MEAFAGVSSIQFNKSDAVKRAEIKLAMMMKYNISFRMADHMVNVLKDCKI